MVLIFNWRIVTPDCRAKRDRTFPTALAIFRLFVYQTYTIVVCL